MIRPRPHRVSWTGIVFVLVALFPIAVGYPATIGSKFPIATTAMRELSIGAAFDGTNFLVGIQGDATAHYNITAQLVSQSGTLVGTRISVGRTGGAPFVAFDGTNYLMVWPDDATHPNDVLYGQFVAPTGTLVGSAFQVGPLDATGDIGGLAFGGGNYLFVYFRQVDAVHNYHRVYGRMISPSGAVGNEFSISSGYGNQGLQNVAFDGSNFMVVWTDDGNDYEVKGQFVSPSGALGTEFTVNASTYPSDNPLSVAFGGGNYLVVWMDEVGGYGSREWAIFGQRVDTSGGLIGGPIPISSAPSGQYFPLLAFEGTNFLVTWTDMRNDTNHDGICDNNEGTCLDIYGRFISPAGTAVGPEFPITTDPGNQFLSPVVFGGGKYLVVWTIGDAIDGTIGDVYGAFVSSQGPTLQLQLNQSDFNPWQQLTLTASVTPGPTPVTADVYVAVQLPDKSLLFLQGDGSITPTLQPIVRNWTIGPYNGKIFAYTFNGGEPVGDYAWLAAFTEPGTLTFIGLIVSAPFTFSP